MAASVRRDAQELPERRMEKPEKARIIKILCVLRCFLLVGVFWCM